MLGRGERNGLRSWIKWVGFFTLYKQAPEPGAHLREGADGAQAQTVVPDRHPGHRGEALAHQRRQVLQPPLYPVHAEVERLLHRHAERRL